MVVAQDGGVLRMSVRRAGDTAVLELAGEADISSVARLSMRVRDLVCGDVRHVVVLGRQLAFLDLAALDVLLDASAALGARGGSLVLQSPSRRVRRLVELLQLDGQLPVRD
ncbi:MAG: STAS domain-containing protein [Actinomycetes bacterium]